MATAYVGPRPILRGVDSSDMVNPYTTMTGKVKGTGTYSYYPLYNTSHLLTGAPDTNHVIGTGYFPGDVFMSQLFKGSVLYIHPLSGTFPDGSHYVGSRFRPSEFKGLSGSAVFGATFGHSERENEYKHRAYRFAGLSSAQAFSNPGHAPRTDAQGAPSTFGLFRPYEEHFVPSGKIFTATFGQAIPTGYNNEYGKNKVQEWRGVASSKAL
jgi:hypothetical protein